MKENKHTSDVQVYQLPEETKEAISILSERTAEISKTVGEAVKKIADATAPLKELTEKAIKSIRLFQIEFSNEYEAIQIQFDDYFKTKGIIRPKGIDDFLLWLSVKNPDKLMLEMIDEAKKANNYKLYHEYKERCFNDSGWNLEKELQYWRNKDTGDIEATTNGSRETKKTPQLSDLINHVNRFDIVEGIKSKYKNIGGKHLKLLLMALQELNLIPKYNYNRKFHDYCEREFDWDIKSYQAMNDYSYNEHSDYKELESIKDYIKTLMDTK
jgi:hypothetical protein